MLIAECNSYTTNMRGELKSPLVPLLFTKTPIDCSWTIDGGIILRFDPELLRLHFR